jgi:WD40 repeat protein
MRLSATLDGRVDAVQAVAFSPGGRWIAATEPGATKVWDARTGKLVRVLNGPQNAWARGLAFSPQGTRLATIVDDHRVEIFGVQTGESLVNFETEGQHLTSIAYSHDGSQIVTAARSGPIEIFDAQNGAHLRTLRCPRFDESFVFAVAMAPDGSVTSVGNEICTWQGNSEKILDVKDTGGQAIAVSPDADWVGVVTTPSPFYLVKIWSTRRNRTVGYLGLSGVAALGFSSDGARLCAGGDRLALWDLTVSPPVSVHEIRSGYTTHYSFTACALSSDRHHLAAADGEHSQLMVLDLD